MTYPFSGGIGLGVRGRTPRASWSLVTGPIIEPVTLDEVKQHARILYSDDDEVFYRFIGTAREAAEEALQRGLLTQTWQLALDWFYPVMFLPMAAPLQNDPLATPSTAPIVQYYDTNGTLQTLAPTVYTVDTTSRPGSIVRAANQVWPPVQMDRAASRVLITYVVGWTSADLVPARIKQGIRSYIAYLDADREGLEENQQRAYMAAQNCWLDKVSWIEPEQWPMLNYNAWSHL